MADSPADGHTEITLASGIRIEVEGPPDRVEAAIISAARGSILQLTWMTELGSGRSVAVNPDHVAMLRAAGATD